MRPLLPLLALGALATAAPAERSTARDDGARGGDLGQEPAASLTTTSAAEDAARHSLERGLAWLSKAIEESPDGALPRQGAEEWGPVGVTALGALALMAGGNLPGRGPHGAAVERTVGYLLGKCDLDPLSARKGYISASGDALSRMHGHGYATLVLAEAYGMSPWDGRLKRALVAAVDVTQASQTSEGGWWYEPERGAQHEGSVTICLVQSLRAARNSGIEVERDVVRRAEDYVERLQKADGTFRYMLEMEKSTVALTAASIATLNMAGRYEDTVIQRGADAIWTRLEDRRSSGGASDWPLYERLHLAQALWQLSDDESFQRWFEAERTRVLREQERDGSWRSRRYGDAYATAVNCLVLALPEGLLPIFQR
jgi:hypothetical protein